MTQGAGAPTSDLTDETVEVEYVSQAPQTTTISTVVLDHFLDARTIRSPALIEIDIEGHGAHALRRAKQTLAAYHPTIVISFHSAWEVEQTRELLETLGYQPLNTQRLTIDWFSTSFRGTGILRCP